MGPPYSKPQSFQRRDHAFTMAMTEFCAKFSNFEYITLWSIHFIFQLLGWIESKEMQLYFRNFPPFNCQCGHAWRTPSPKENRIHFENELIYCLVYKWKIQIQVTFPYSKRPINERKMLHILQSAISLLHYTWIGYLEKAHFHKLYHLQFLNVNTKKM